MEAGTGSTTMPSATPIEAELLDAAEALAHDLGETLPARIKWQGRGADVTDILEELEQLQQLLRRFQTAQGAVQ